MHTSLVDVVEARVLTEAARAKNILLAHIPPHSANSIACAANSKQWSDGISSRISVKSKFEKKGQCSS
jgi:hypothetical protein